jgi:hypothetical protein
MAVASVNGTSSDTQSSNEGTTVQQDAFAIQAIDLRGQPAADGATWAVFTFFFLVVVGFAALCAMLAAARLRRIRIASAPLACSHVKPAANNDLETFPYAG